MNYKTYLNSYIFRMKKILICHNINKHFLFSSLFNISIAQDKLVKEVFQSTNRLLIVCCHAYLKPSILLKETIIMYAASQTFIDVLSRIIFPAVFNHISKITFDKLLPYFWQSRAIYSKVYL